MPKKINLHGVVGWDIMAKDVNAEIDDSDGDLIFDMNSGGGYITEGVSIVNAIRNYKGGKTIARVSYSASMMTQIALACDEVQVYDNAIFMVHNAQGFASGDHNEMEARRKHLKSMSTMLANLYVKKTGKTEKEVLDMMDATTYMFGQEIVDEGFADVVIETDDDKDVALATENATINFNKSMDAMKEEGLSASQLGDELKMCEKGCALNGSKTPSNQGKNSEFNEGEPVKTKAEKEAEKKLQEDLATANATIGTHEEAMDGKDAQIVALETKVTEKETEISALKNTPDAQAITTQITTAVTAKEEALMKEFEGIMALSIEMQAPKDVAMEMIACSTLEEATAVCNTGLVSAGITFGGNQGGGQEGQETNHGWGNIMKKKGN